MVPELDKLGNIPVSFSPILVGQEHSRESIFTEESEKRTGSETTEADTTGSTKPPEFTTC